MGRQCQKRCRYSPNAFKQAVIAAGPGQGKLNLFTSKEAELTGMSEKADFNFFRDTTYEELEHWHNTAAGVSATNLIADWYKEVMPFHLAQELETLHEIIANPDQYVSYREVQGTDTRALILLDAEQRLKEIMGMKIDQKKTQLTKEHVLAYLGSEKVVSITVLPPAGYPRIDRVDAMHRLFGPDKSIEDLTADESQMVTDEINITSSRGYDIGFDETQGEWFDRAVYAEYGSSVPQGANFGNDYREAFIRQQGGGIRTGATGHFGNSSHRQGVLVHVRTGVAEVFEIEGQETPIAMSEATQGKLLSLVELQSDWLQNLRKNFKSADDQQAAERRKTEIAKAITSANQEMGTAVTDYFIGKIHDMLKPVANLPEGSLGEEYVNYVEGLYGTRDIPGGISENEAATSYKDFRNEILDTMIRDAEAMRSEIDELTRGNDLFGETAGSLDIRAFEALDKYAMRQFAASLYSDINNLVDNLRQLQGATTQERFVQAIQDIIMSRPLRYFNDLMRTGLERGASLRTPVAKVELKKLLTTFFERTAVLTNSIPDAEAAPDVAERIVAAMGERQKVVYKVPLESMRDYGRAVHYPESSAAYFANAVSSWFSNSRLLDNNLNPNKFSLKVEPAPSGEAIDISVVGSEASVQEVSEEKVKAIIETWIDDNSVDDRARNIRGLERRRRIDAEYARLRQGDGPTWNDITIEFDFDEVDVDERNGQLDDEGVYSYDEWEEDRIGDERDSIVEYEIAENTNWDEVTDSDGNSLSREGEHYRELLVVDEDGDVDNSDAEEWIRDARQEYETNLYEADWIYEQAADSLRQQFYEDPSMLWIGHMPIEWDEDGDTEDTVKVVLKQDNPGDTVDLLIDENMQQSWHSKRDAFNSAPSLIRAYYENEAIAMPAGFLLAPVPEEVIAEQAAEPATVMPNWDVVKGSVTEAITRHDVGGESTEAMFNELVTLSKKSGVGVDTPLKKDEYYRNMVLKYLISDAVRRGFPGIIWNPGLATSARGGAAFEGVVTDRITWSAETITVRDKSHEVWVIGSPDMAQPMAVSKAHSVPVLGADVAAYISQQMAGKLPLVPPTKGETTEPKVWSADDYLISTVEDTNHLVVHRRNDTRQMGIFTDQESAETAIAGWVRELNADLQYVDTATETGRPEPLGEVTIQGEVNRDVIGGRIRIITGYRNNYYSHTYGIPTLGGARQSYEDISPRIWNKTLKEFGVEVGEIYIKAQSIRKAERKEGARVKKVDTRADAIASRHGSLTIREVSGNWHGWVVFSETEGVIGENVHTNRAAAEAALNDYINYNFGEETGGIKAFYIPINEKMREKFSGPVPPFHYDPTLDPQLKAAAEKIGYEKTTLLERTRKWREAWADHFQQGMFDKFYGIKRAMRHAGEQRSAAGDPYIQTRLTTSLDSVMKAVLEYGHPVWKEGIMQTEGDGLIEILQPVMNDIDTWGMYMAGVRAKRLLEEGREKLFEPEEIDAMIALGETYPSFKRVAARYAAFNKSVLDFAQEAGVINPETRTLWENADYVPFYRVEDERLVGPFAGSAGIANQRSPIKRLKGGEANIGNVVHNIFVNLTKLMDTSMKNHAALLAVDALRGSGIVSKQPMTHSQEMIPLQQVKKLLIDRGMNPNTIPQSALDGFQKMFAIQPPSGPGVISVLRKGKKEFYYTDDEILYRAMTNINKKAWGPWMNLFRAPKRLLTTLVTLDPGFMAANWVRDSLSAFVLSRDKYIPIAAGIKGMGQALVKDEAMRTMLSAGAAFESGYINQYDPQATAKLIKREMKKKSFARTVLNSPVKLFQAWKAIGSATENANRLAVYNAAIRAGKGKAQAAFEAKDLMDFSMGGDWPAIQFLIQTVPFLGARMQGAHRLGRGFTEHPLAFTLKGALVGAAGLALWFAFRDDERYKELEDWDKDVYFHWWIGENHYRLPKPFEVGAIFNTIPERIFEYIYSNENDKGQLLLKRFGFALAETFNANPIPQTFRPMVESYFNYNFFTGRQIVTPYEEDRMAPEEYRQSTSPTFVELARLMPGALDTVSGKVRSPLHLENLYRGYTGTLGRYFLMAADELVRQQMDYPNPPEFRTGDYPISGRFFRGDEPRRTRYEEEVYRLIRKTAEVQGSLRFLEKTEQLGRFENIQTEWEPYIRVASSLENIREQVSEINKAVMQTYMDESLDPAEKRSVLDTYQEEKNALFELGYELRPGGAENLEAPVTQEQIIDLIENFGVDEKQARQLEDSNPETFDLVGMIDTLGMRELKRLAATRNK
jgi:hypothetical protein